MRIFIVSMLFVLSVQASMFLTLGLEHVVYALLCSASLWAAIKLENQSVAKELHKNIQSSKRQISKIIPIITKEVKPLNSIAVKQGALS